MNTAPPEITITPTPPLDPSSPNPSRFRILLIIIIFIILTITTVFASFLIKSQNNSPSASPSSTPPTSPPSPTPDSTVNWKTFTSQKFNFSISYPSNYFEEADRIPGFLYLLPPKDATYLKNTGISVKVYQPIKDTLEKYISDNFKDTTSKETLNINSLPGYKMTSHGSKNLGESIETHYFYIALLKKDEDIYNISLDSIDYNEYIKSSSLFDQILSTFKFIDSPDETSCQTDSDCGVELCGCTAKNRNFIDTNKNICTVMCGDTKCTNNKCTLQPYKGY